MKLKENNRQGMRMIPPKVKFTADEILADLVYPAPLADRDDDRTREHERNVSR